MANPHLKPTGFPFDVTRATLATPDGDIHYWVGTERLRETYARGVGGKTIVPVFVSWDDVPEFKRHALGFTTWRTGATYLDRVTPLHCPWTDGTDGQYLDELSIITYGTNTDEPFEEDVFLPPDSGGEGWWRCAWAGYDASFVTMPYDVLIDAAVRDLKGGRETSRYVRRIKRTQYQELKVVSNTFVFEANPNRDVGSFFRPFYSVELVYVWQEVPLAAVPWAVINGYAGHVNSVAFDADNCYGPEYPAETILFKGLAQPVEWYRGPNAEKYVDLHYIFGEQPLNFNKAPKSADVTDWDYMVIPGTSTKPYQGSDLKKLFVPGATP